MIDSKLWRVYYDNNSIITSRPIESAGVIAVAVADETHNWTFWYGKDWYIMMNDQEWMGTDTNGMIDQILHNLQNIAHICQGRTLVPYSRYQNIIDRMIEDCRPEKTGWHPGEK